METPSLNEFNQMVIMSIIGLSLILGLILFIGWRNSKDDEEK